MIDGGSRMTHGKGCFGVLLSLLLAFALGGAETKPSADSDVLLTPQAARIHGFKLHVEKGPKPAIVHWVDAQEYVEWPRAVKKRGSYDVEITYSCAPGAGGEFTLAA